MEDGKHDERPRLLDPDAPASQRLTFLVIVLVAIGGLAVILVSALIGVLT